MKKEPLPQDTAMLITITHSKPIEMSDLVNTLNGIGNTFDDYCKRNGDSSEGRKAKLYVEKIEHGSIDILLTEALTLGMLPLLENCNVIMEFAGYVKNVLGYFINGNGSKPELTRSELQHLKDSLSVVVHDNKGDISFGAVDRKNVNISFNDCNVTYIQGNVAQNQINDAIEECERVRPSEKIHTSQLMQIRQLRSDMESNSGNRARIDALCKRDLPVYFDTPELKRIILASVENPTLRAFMVDVVLQTIDNKPASYKVMHLHDVVPLEE